MPVVNDHRALLSGTSWSGRDVSDRPAFVTFAFPTVAPASHAAADIMGGAVGTFRAFDAADQALARQALAAWAEACGLVFLEVQPGEGDITFSWYDFSASPWDGAGAIGFFPFGPWDFASYPEYWDQIELSGDMLFNRDFAVAGQPGYGLLLHELGHALGIKDPNTIFGSYDATLDPALDNTAQTVTSYNGPEPTTLGALDRIAIAEMYGSPNEDGGDAKSWSWNAATRTLTQRGGGTDDVLQGVSTRDSIAGKGGDDRLFGKQGIDTIAGGDGADTIYGGADNDVLKGDAGDDAISGNDGADKLTGGAGNDTLSGGAGRDRFLFGADFGDDAINDFADGTEKLSLIGIPGVTGFADVTIGDWFGTALVIVAGHGSILLWGLAPGQLSASDFAF